MKRVGEITADGEITEEEADSLWFPLAGIFLAGVLATVLESLPARIQMLIGGALTAVDMADRLESAIEGIDYLIVYLNQCEQAEEAGFEDSCALDDEVSIVIPPL